LLAVSKGKRHTDLVYEYGGADITYFISADGSWRGRERNLELSKAATRAMLDVLAACEKEVRLCVCMHAHVCGRVRTRACVHV
jgi:hypothetical protein